MGNIVLRMRGSSVPNLNGVQFSIINPAAIDPFCINKLLSKNHINKMTISRV